MATQVPVTLDTLITIKISIEGSTRKVKVPLRDLGANVFESKLCSLLSIPPNQKVVFERYSDSASSYITLDPNNTQVYKTLFRAAKAKLKLRLRATPLDEKVEEPIAGPSGTSILELGPSPSAPIALNGVSLAQPVQQAEATNIPQAQMETKELGSILPHPLPQVNLALRTKENAAPAPVNPPTCSWSVYCNHCDKPMANEHYHCSICDEGDYDLCGACVNAGRHCYGETHWLIKRFVQNGQVINSTSQKVASSIKPPVEEAEIEKESPCVCPEEKKADLPQPTYEPQERTRTCNSCIKTFPETDFVNCKDCDDFDLCILCHVGAKHGHHPGHTFMPATPNTNIGPLAEFLCNPGRNVRHAAVCDGCDKYIYGVRHKCLNCPDWDYCSKCIKDAKYKHATHRFVAIYDPLPEPRSVSTRHFGIYCDGPLCKDKHTQSYIEGVRYKCAVCHDTDFCANCEASPSNRHNRTHPLIKFKTPVRNVSVTTMGEHGNGAPLPAMGDRRSTSTETLPVPSANAATQVQTVVDLKPSEETSVKKEKIKIQDLLAEPIEEKIKVQEPIPAQSRESKSVSSDDLTAHFVRDTVSDGTKVLPGALFTQVWTLRNPGPHVWPANCSVKYVGGDNMLNVDDSQPSSSAEINEATESNVISHPVEVNDEVTFRVLMKAPKREGTAISYWRLKTADGHPFGHRLWCHVDVTASKQPAANSSLTPSDQLSAQLEMLRRSQLSAHARHLQARYARDQTQRLAVAPQEGESTSAKKSGVDDAVKRHAEVRAQAIENMRRAAERMDAELERMALATKQTAQPVPEPLAKSGESSSSQRGSMIFPRLEKESPVSSTHEAVTAPTSNAPTVQAGSEAVMSPSIKSDLEFFEDAETVEYSDSSDEGFATDEEYDILDASDQETM